MDDATGDETAHSPEDAFGVLGHETRLAILHALWEAQDPDRYPDVQPVPFADLRKRVGMGDGSQFNYHLKQLVGPFVHRTDEGYVLRRTGERLLTAVLSGTLTDDVVMEAVPVDDPCPLCGGEVVMDYGVDPMLDNLVVRCTDCEGAFDWEDVSGVLSVGDLLPPVGVHRRSGADLQRAQAVWNEHVITSLVEDVCPHCGGTVDVTPLICEDHRTDDGPCEACGTIFEVLFSRKCEVCKFGGPIPLDRHLLVHPTVAAFLEAHGYDPWGPGGNWLRITTETIETQTVVSADPLEIEVDLAIDGERLTVTLDGEGRVVDVRE